jgi:hypothetical protein
MSSSPTVHHNRSDFNWLWHTDRQPVKMSAWLSSSVAFYTHPCVTALHWRIILVPDWDIMLLLTHPKNQTYGYTKYQQVETTHKHVWSLLVGTLCALWKPQNRESSLSVEWWDLTSTGAKGPEVPSAFFFVPSCWGSRNKKNCSFLKKIILFWMPQALICKLVRGAHTWSI